MSIELHLRDLKRKVKGDAGRALLKRVVDALKQKLVVTDTIFRGDTMFIGVTKGPFTYDVCKKFWIF